MKWNAKKQQAVFSTPFLSLNDDLEFNALEKIWIFIVANIALTTAPFEISALFDQSSRQRQAAVQSSGETTGTEAASHNGDRGVLEPGPWIDVVDVLLLVLDEDSAAGGKGKEADPVRNPPATCRSQAEC